MKKASEKNKVGYVFTRNIPNLLTIFRIVLTFVVMYLIFTDSSLKNIVVIFVVAALTDFFDGRLARKFKWESEFGRRADVIADRFLWVGTALAFVIAYGLEGRLSWEYGLQLALIMTREIFCFPFSLMAFFSGGGIPKVRMIGKITTFLQGFALPALILSIDYPKWFMLSVPLSVACFVAGAISALYYVNDLKETWKKK